MSEFLQIGRNCLADFCRSPEFATQLCGYAELMASAAGFCEIGEESEGFCGNRAPSRVSVGGVLSLTARVIRGLGWTSRTEAQKSGCGSTSDTVRSILFDPKFLTIKGNEDIKAIAESVAEQDEQLATKAIEWVRSLRDQADSLNDYLYNLVVVLAEETMLAKHLGLACSAISAYNRHVEGEVRKVYEKTVRAQSKHLGNVGDRIAVIATFMGSSSFESQFGVTHLYRFASEGNVINWWTGTELDLAKGADYAVLGTVKKHDDYKGTAQTVLTRCTVEDAATSGKCSECSGIVLEQHKGKKCPWCKEAGRKTKLKISDSCFAAKETVLVTEAANV